MEKRLTDPEPTSVRQKAFEQALKKCQNFVRNVVKARKDNPSINGSELLIDVLIETATNEDTLISDAISYVVGGFHTTANCEFLLLLSA